MPIRWPLVGLSVAVPLLACSGIQEGFNQGVETSFRDGFVSSCAAEEPLGLGAEQMQAICTCAADSLLAQYGATELLALTAQDPAAIATQAEPVVRECITKVTGGAPPAPAAADAGGEVPAGDPPTVPGETSPPAPLPAP